MLPRPAPDEIHVWRIALDVPPPVEERALVCLPPDEQADLARFGRPELRRRALIAHAAMRMLLARYLGIPAPTVRFELGEFGKPRLAPDVGTARPPIHVNLSHSKDRALIAVTRDVPVGVDVEQLRAVRQIEALAARYLAPDEARWLLALPSAARSASFLRLWVGKEAIAKADGTGLQFGLRRIALQVAATGESSLRLATLDDDPRAAGGWTLETLRQPGDYVAAVAAPRPGMRVCPYTFEIGSARGAH